MKKQKRSQKGQPSHFELIADALKHAAANGEVLAKLILVYGKAIPAAAAKLTSDQNHEVAVFLCKTAKEHEGDKRWQQSGVGKLWKAVHSRLEAEQKARVQA